MLRMPPHAQAMVDDASGDEAMPTAAQGKVRTLPGLASSADLPELTDVQRVVPAAVTQLVPEAMSRLHLVRGVVARDRSALSESFRMLRNQVLQRMRAEGHQLLAITSARRIEGKSLTAVNLALTIAADFDSTVLLVDADLNGNGLQRLFGLGDRPGLSDHLTQGTPLCQLLVNPGQERFVILPAGKEAGLNSAELLATRTAQQLFHEIRHRYPDRYVIVDLPPVLDTADAVAFLPQAETTLVVVEEHTTALGDIERMAELLAPFNVMGTVMSQAPERERPAPGAAGRGQPVAGVWRRWLGRPATRTPVPWYAEPAGNIDDHLAADAGGRSLPWYRRWLRREG